MRKLLSGAAILLIAFTLGGCGQTSHGEGSRSRLYSSLEELAADSPVVVVAAGDERDVDARMSRTSTASTVVDVVRGDVEVGNQLIVWQMGTPEAPGPSPLLSARSRYLLFVTPTGLDGAAPNEYWVVGGTAGLWSDAGGSYVRVADEGDALPSTITLDEVVAAASR